MHTEHLENVEPSWVIFGWFIGAAVSSLVLMAMFLVGLVSEESGSGGWALLAVIAGSLAGGFVIGMRTGAAPILHAVCVGLVTLVVWLAFNILAAPLGASTLRETSPSWVIGGILLQMLATWGGAHLASAEARRESRPL